MKKQTPQIFILLVLAGALSVLAGCSPGARLPCPEGEEAAAYLEPGEGLVALTIENNVCMSVCQLFVSPNHCEYVGGENWVQDHPLRSGESITRYVPIGKYAFRVELCSEEFRADEGLKVYSDYQHTILDELTKRTKSCGTSLKIENDADVPICRLYISNTDSAYTSWNWLGAEHIQPGESLDLTVRPVDEYIIRAEACDGTWLRSESGLVVSGHQTWTVP